MLASHARKPLVFATTVLAVAFVGSAGSAAIADPTPGAPAAAESEPCFECHGVQQNALDAEVQVDEAKWAASVHGQAGVTCDTCHSGKADVPHAESDPWPACAERRRAMQTRGHRAWSAS